MYARRLCMRICYRVGHWGFATIGTGQPSKFLRLLVERLDTGREYLRWIDSVTPNRRRPSTTAWNVVGDGEAGGDYASVQ